MTITELLAELEALNVRLEAEGGRLRVNAPKGSLTPALQAELSARKEELLRVLGERAVGGTAAAPRLAAIARNGTGLPLSFFQERLWVLDQLTPGDTTYSIATLARPEETIDAELLQQAVARVVARHEILRSRFVLEGAGPVVRIGDGSDVPIVIEDLRPLSAEAREAKLAAAGFEAAHHSYDLSAEPPVRFTIFRVDDSHVVFLIAAHHIAVDAWSFGVLFREVHTEYAAVCEGRAAGDRPRLQYVDFAAWQRRAMQHPDVSDRLAYWKRRLAGLPQLSTFPFESSTTTEPTNNGATIDFAFSPELYAGARALARQSGATVYMVMLAGMAAVLHRHTGQKDLALGSPVGTRAFAELENIVGPVVNPLVMRFDLSDDPTFAQLITRAREAVLDGHANQDVPFERIVQELNPERLLGHAPLFQVAVVLHNVPAGGGVMHEGGALYDLTVFAAEGNDTITGSIEYRTDLYSRETVERIFTHLQNILGAGIENPQRRISALPMLGEDERRRLTAFNATDEQVDRSTLVAQFRRMAATKPNDVAVVADGGRSVTYGELAKHTSAIATRLRAAAVRRGDFVALAVDRSAALPAAALGILASGAAYLPLDLDYPAERVSFMLHDSGARHIVTTTALASKVRALAGDVTVILADDPVAPEMDVGSDGPAQGDDPAYLIYTSGSTGQPKGVVVPHSAVSNFLGAVRKTFAFTADDSMVAVTSPAFDISVLELFVPLVEGGRLIIATRDEIVDGAKLARLLEKSGATMFQSTPSGWRLLINAGWAGNDRLCAIAGGEAMTRELAEWLLPRSRVVWNAYGPTETTVWSTAARIHRDDRITIGQPVANTRVYVINEGGSLMPIGAPGEICIAGDGVTSGYHKRPELTASRFVPAIEGAGRMYRTGDIGRWLGDGRLEHLGRADGQIKLRGHRIETGEIESALATHPAIRASVVGVSGVNADDQRLVAWVQFRDDEDVTTSELRRHLRKRLPEFMVPSLIVPVEAIPMTPNGKVNRRALPDPFASAGATRIPSAPPTTPTERVIADVWRRLLNVRDISVNDAFFDLGGHSLLAMRAAAEIASVTKHAFDPRLLFFRTLGQIAEACDAAAALAPVDRA